MSTRLEISEQIEKDMKDSIQANRGYNFTPSEIKRGIHKFNDFTMFPAIAFDFINERPDGIGTARIITYRFYGWTDTSDWVNSNDIYKVLEDLESFIDSEDNTFSNCAYIQEINMIEGGVSSPQNFVEMFVEFTFDLT